MSENIQGNRTAPRQGPARAGAKKKKKSSGGLIVLIVVVVLILGAAALLFFNVNNIRDSVFDTVRDWPMIGALIPAADGAGPARLTPAELQANNNLLQRQVENLNRDVTNLRQTNENLQAEVERLREFERTRVQDARDRELFDQMVQDHAGLSEFWRFFQNFDPDRAEEIAREAAGQEAMTREVRDFLNMIREMSPGTAADFLADLFGRRSPLVVNILQGLNAGERAMIMEEFDTEIGAELLNLMSPPGLIN